MPRSAVLGAAYGSDSSDRAVSPLAPRTGSPDSLSAAHLALPATSLKLVYWGPGLSGKTSNLKWLHARLRPELRGRMVTLDSIGERTIYFDCLPLDLDPGHGAPIRLRLYTVPGQPRFQILRRLVLRGVDGLVFVWDSRTRRVRENVRSLLEARLAVEESGLDWERLPRVIQLNKQDLAPLTPADQVELILGRLGETAPRVPAVATDGVGVRETLAAIARRTIAARMRMG